MNVVIFRVAETEVGITGWGLIIMLLIFGATASAR